MKRNTQSDQWLNFMPQLIRPVGVVESATQAFTTPWEEVKHGEEEAAEAVQADEDVGSAGGQSAGLDGHQAGLTLCGGAGHHRIGHPA
jgi:hypothetical protein